MGEKRKCLLLVVPTWSSYDVFLRELATQASVEGWEVHVACQLSSLHGGGVDTGNEVVSIHDVSVPRGMSLGSVFSAAKELRGLVASIDPDVIQAHFSMAAFVLAVARKQAWKGKSIAVIQGLVYPAVRGWRRFAAKCIETYLSRRLDETWVLTADDLNSLQALRPRKAIQQQAPGFGVRNEVFDSRIYGAEQRSLMRAELGWDDGAVVFVYVGRFVQFKGFSELLQACDRLKHPNLKLLLIGCRDERHSTGLSEEGYQQHMSCAWIQNVGHQENVAKWLSISDVLVLTSCREGMPVSLMEAVCMGLPIITTNSRGCREVVNDGEFGLTVPFGDVEALRVAIAQMCESQELRNEFSDNGLAARVRFSREHFVREHLDHFEQIVAGSPLS